MKWIELTQGKRTCVDDDVFEWASLVKWTAARAKHTWYAYRKDSGKTLWLHRAITRAKEGWEVDHRDGNGLNNLRSNFRIVTHAGNAQARQTPRKGKSSRYRGVRFHKTSQKWTAQIKTGGRNRWLGSFQLEEDAARAYDFAARRLFGELAQLNFLQ
jgi:hypothetical protein